MGGRKEQGGERVETKVVSLVIGTNPPAPSQTGLQPPPNNISILCEINRDSVKMASFRSSEKAWEGWCGQGWRLGLQGTAMPTSLTCG